MLRHSNNGQFFGCVDGKPSADRMQSIWSMVQQRILARDRDHIRLFVKPEVHTERKLSSEKYRLISSVSVVDQLVDHMLFKDLNDKMIANWALVPSKPGWSIFGGGWRFMPRETWVATDASSWDWTVQPWLLELVLEFRKRLCANLDPKWVELAEWRYSALFNDPTFVTSAGLVLRQMQPGVMKSGCVNTITDNSLMQVLLHIRVCLELDIPIGYLFTMGDDKLQEPPQDHQRYFEVLSQFCVLKSIERRNEFSGFRFHRRWVDPVQRQARLQPASHGTPCGAGDGD